MKKFLSLVLALVMTMSLVTISASADFTDDSTITYEEAVDVMTAIGVVGGYADGSFNPTAGLTRGAAAKIICNMIMGPTEAEALGTTDAPYSDVPAGSTFAGYISYCASEGIISGYADGTFKPAAPLTGYAFMKMLLGALGYDAAVEGYTGTNWSVQVAKRALNIELDDGLVGSFNGAKALTREEACLYAFNALQADMVEYDNNTSISVGDITITTSTKAEKTGDTFMEKYFEDLSSKDSKDAFGRPATEWKYDKEDVGTYADAADYIFVLDDDYDDTDDYDDLAAVLAELSDEDIEGVQAGAKTFVNGVKNADVQDAATYGTTIEVYVDDDDIATDVIAYYYEIAEITDVDDEVTTADAKKDVTCYVEIDGVDTLNDTDIAGFDADTYVEDAYIAYIYHNGEIIDSYIPEVVEGELTTVKGSDYVTLDGDKYYAVKASSTAKISDLNVADDVYALYLDANGNIIGVVTVDEVGAEIDEIYLVASTWEKDVDSYGNPVAHHYAQLVAMDGTVTEVELEKLDKNDKTGNYLGYTGALVTISDKKWTNDGTTYKAGNEKYDLKAWDNEDFEYTAPTALTNDLAKTTTRTTIGGATYRLNSATEYILVEGTYSDLDVTTKTGGIALKATTTEIDGENVADYNVIVITEEDSKVALYVIVISNDISEANTFSSDNVVYIKSLSSEKGDGYRVQTVYLADGSKENWKVDADEYDTLAKGKFYSYDTNDDGYYVFEEIDAMTETGVWEDGEDEWTGALCNVEFVELFDSLLSVEGVADIETEDAAFIDLHDTDDDAQDSKTMKTLEALADRVEDKDYTATLNILIDEDGAVLIVLAELAK